MISLAEAPIGAPTILAAGDSEVVALMSDLLQRERHAVARVYDGWTALDRLRQSSPDLALLDVGLPGLDGMDVCRLAKRDQVTRLIPLILISDVASREERLDSIDAGADELLSKPIDVHELIARVHALVRMKRFTDDFELVSSVMMTLATVIEARDRYSEGHCHRIANYAAALGRRIDLTSDDQEVVRRGGFLHDIGMLAVPDSVLNKPSALEPEEYALVRSHTVIGESLIANLRSLQSVRSVVRHHHEKLDGSGYPDGLRGDDIPLPAQIVGVVDVYEAVTSPRPYQQARSSANAIAMLREQVRLGWRSHDLVEHFASLVQSTRTPPPPGSVV